MIDPIVTKIQNNPKYLELRSKRNTLGVTAPASKKRRRKGLFFASEKYIPGLLLRL